MWVLVLPGPRVNGPRNFTTGKNLLALFADLSMTASSPPIANTLSRVPPKAPRTKS